MPTVFVCHAAEDPLIAESMPLVSASLILLDAIKPHYFAEYSDVVAAERQVPPKRCG